MSAPLIAAWGPGDPGVPAMPPVALVSNTGRERCAADDVDDDDSFLSLSIVSENVLQNLKKYN